MGSSLEKLSAVGARLATTAEVVVRQGPPLLVRTIEAFERVGVALEKLTESVPEVTAQLERLNDSTEAWTKAWNSASELRSHPALDESDHDALMEQHERQADKVRGESD